MGQQTLFHSNRDRIQHETLRRNLISTFNLFADSVALERHRGWAYARRPAEETLRQWNFCRRTVERLGKDYASSVAQYRKAVRDSFTPRLREIR